MQARTKNTTPWESRKGMETLQVTLVVTAFGLVVLIAWYLIVTQTSSGSPVIIESEASPDLVERDSAKNSNPVTLDPKLVFLIIGSLFAVVAWTVKRVFELANQRGKMAILHVLSDGKSRFPDEIEAAVRQEPQLRRLRVFRFTGWMADSLASLVAQEKVVINNGKYTSVYTMNTASESLQHPVRTRLNENAQPGDTTGT